MAKRKFEVELSGTVIVEFDDEFKSNPDPEDPNGRQWTLMDAHLDERRFLPGHKWEDTVLLSLAVILGVDGRDLNTDGWADFLQRPGRDWGGEPLRGAPPRPPRRPLADGLLARGRPRDRPEDRVVSGEVYRSRWDVCDDCDILVVVERHDDRGVPAPEDWDQFPQCPVCGGSLGMGNADHKSQADIEYAKGRAVRQPAINSLYRLIQHLAAEMMSIGDQCEISGQPGNLGYQCEISGQPGNLGYSGSGRCNYPSVAIRWEYGYVDLVCEGHAQSARERKVLVAYPKRANGTMQEVAEVPEMLRA